MTLYVVSADQWCCLRFRFATATRSTVLARLCPAGAGAPYGSVHYESVHASSGRVRSGPEQGRMSLSDRAGRARTTRNCNPLCTLSRMRELLSARRSGCKSGPSELRSVLVLATKSSSSARVAASGQGRSDVRWDGA